MDLLLLLDPELTQFMVYQDFLELFSIERKDYEEL